MQRFRVTALVSVFLQNFSVWALVLGPCIKLRENCGPFRVHKVFVATESRIVLPKTDNVNRDLFLWEIFLKMSNPPNNGLFGINLSNFRFPFVLLLWTQIVRLSYCGIVAFKVPGLLVTRITGVSFSPRTFST